MIEIKNYITSQLLYKSDLPTLKQAVEQAIKEGANLCGANLSDAILSGVEGIQDYLTSPMFMLLDQPGKIRLEKLVNRNGVGPYIGGIKYEIGKKYEVTDANTDKYVQCGPGINVAFF